MPILLRAVPVDSADRRLAALRRWRGLTSNTSRRIISTMRFWRKHDAGPPGFDWQVVPCNTREAAEAEAKKQQAMEREEALWIYLRIKGQWSAKRTPPDILRPTSGEPSRAGVLPHDPLYDLMWDP